MKKVLIIEDDPLVANVYRNKLQVDGFEVEVATDGEAGLAQTRSFRPDVVLLDLMLPKLPGLDLIKKLRSESDFKQLPLIVFSSTYLSNLVMEAWKAGATKCLSKASCTPQQIIEVVRASVGTDGSATTTATSFFRVPGGKNAPATQTVIEARPAPPISDTEFQTDLKKSFADSFPVTLGTLRGHLQTMFRAENEVARLNQLQEMHRKVRSLTANAGLADMQQIAQLSDALEVLLKELHEKPANINASTLRTVASAVDFLGVLFLKRGGLAPGADPAKILVVDDEPISLRAVSFALEKARLKPVTVQDPLVALTMCGETKYDLIFLDVDMPNMTGFELCSKIRTEQTNKSTPVVFVTGLTTFESRANSTISGGNDFIAKPFLFIELAVKALIHLLRTRLEPVKA